MDETQWTLLGNGPLRWGAAAALFVLGALAGRLAVRLALLRIESLARRTRTDLDDLVAQLLRKTRTLFVLLVAFWVASESLELTDQLERGIESVVVIGLLVQAAFWGSGVVAHLIDRYRERQIEVDPGGATAIGALSFAGRTIVWVVALLLILDNLQIDVTALVTGLGIGGIAVALAMQNVLSDLFASLSIVLDKPFVVGDFVVVGDLMGTVEHVGLKTTHLRSLSGEQIVFSNSDLLGSRIRNYKRMRERRAVFQLGVTYETPAVKLRAIPAIVRSVLEAQPETRFDRSHFKGYGAFSLDFESVYYVLTPDFNRYMDIQQAVNFELFERFHEAGIEFAYPTQTVFARVQGGTPTEASDSIDAPLRHGFPHREPRFPKDAALGDSPGP
jgi:small-conductance mechanosensitive channel